MKGTNSQCLTRSSLRFALFQLRVDARALRIICFNFTTFARKHEDSQSSYKAFATVDIAVPANLSEDKVKARVEVKVKYMGQPLSDQEIQNSEEKALKITSSSKITENSKLAGTNSLSPTATFNTKEVWRRMEEGDGLLLAYQMATALGGTIKMEREFR